MRVSVAGGTGSILSEPGPHRLSTSVIPRPKEIPTRRIADVSISPSLDGIMEGITGVDRESIDGRDPEHWMRLMKSRQN